MSQALVLPPEAWAVQQFGQLDLGDKRRNQRAVRIAAAMAARPDASIPQQMGVVHQAKAAYRFLDRSDLVTFDALTQQHRQQTREAMGQLKRVLLIGDDTEVDYSHHPATRGLELIGDGQGRGFSLHSVLAIDERRQIVGLAHQNLFYRQSIGQGERRRERVERDRQSLVWAKAVRDIGPPPAGVQFIHVNDRASDNWDFYQSCCEQSRCEAAGPEGGNPWEEGNHWINRAAQDRRAALGHGPAQPQGTEQPQGTLMILVRSLAAWGGTKLEVQGGEAPRQAKLLVSASAVTIFPPWLAREGEPVRLWGVRLWEVQAPAGVEPIEWVVLTSLPVNTLEAALQIAQWYSWRWLIEEYHKCLKTGCALEKRQLEEADRLEAVLGILAIVAVRLLALKQQVHQRPSEPALRQVEQLAVQVLVARRKLRKRPEELTLHEFWREVAKLGGFLGRRRDGEPGWQTLWRGWADLQLLVEGAKIAMGAHNRCG